MWRVTRDEGFALRFASDEKAAVVGCTASEGKDALIFIGQTSLIGFISISQVAIFAFLYSAAFEFYTMLYGQIRNDLGFGISMYYSHYVLGALAAANAFVQVVAGREVVKWIAGVTSAAIWLIYWVPILPSMPNRFFLVAVSGIASFALALILLHRNPNDRLRYGLN